MPKRKKSLVFKNSSAGKTSVFKKVLSHVLAFAMVVTSLTILPLFAEEAEAAVRYSSSDELRKAIVQQAMQYVGYGYSQSSRNGDAGTFDCSGLVKTVLEKVGFGNVPTSTQDWYSQITNKTLALTLNNGDGAKAIKIGYDVPVENEKDYYAVIRTYSNADAYASVAEAGDIFIEREKTGDGHAAITVGTWGNLFNGSNSAFISAGEDVADYMSSVGGVSKSWFTDINELRNNKAIGSFVNAYNIYNTQIKSYYPNARIATTELLQNAWTGTPAAVKVAAGYTGSLVDSGARGTVGGKTIYNGLIMDFSENQLNAGMQASDVWRVEALNTNVGVAITNNVGGKESASTNFFIFTLVGYEAEGSAHVEARKILQDASGNNVALTGNEFMITVTNISWPQNPGVTAAGVRTAYNDASGKFTISPDYNFVLNDIDETGDWIFKIEEGPGTKPVNNVTYQDPIYLRINVAGQR